MMNRALPILVVVVAASGACLSERSYVDPQQNRSGSTASAQSDLALKNGNIKGDFGPRVGINGLATEMIGTTDQDYQGDPAKVKATPEEIEYLCASVSEYLAKPVKPTDVVWTYAGVRPLYDDGASEAKAATREYVFELDLPGGAPLLSIYGGKITTHRRLAEEALEKLAPYLKGTKAEEGWTGHAPLPGGDLDVSAIPALTAELQRDYPFLTPFHANRLAHAYGTRAVKILGHAKSIDDLGQLFGASLTEAEVKYLIAEEWAYTTEDIVWRRSKLGLRLTPQEIAALDVWISAQQVAPKSRLAETGGRA